MDNKTQVTRRKVLQGTGVGLAAVSSGLTRSVSSQEEAAPLESIHERPARVPHRREVWVATFCQEKLRANRPAEMIQKVIESLQDVAPLKPDIICLPEVFHVANLSDRPAPVDAAEQPIGPYSRAFAEFARMHRVNIICPIYTVEAGKTYNAALVIDRSGHCLGEYRKINPTDGEIAAGITPGPTDPPVFKLDCATVGIQICFDINWPENWRKLAEKQADVVFWPSAFAGGQMLNAHALMNRYYVISSTRIRGATLVDPLGDNLESTGRFGPWLCQPLNLDYVVIQGWQDIAKLDDLRAQYGRKVAIKVKHVEALALLASLSPQRSAREMAREFGIETSFAMLGRNTVLQKQHRPG